MRIDHRDGTKRSRRICVLDAKTGQVVKAVAIDTFFRKITYEIPAEERTDLFVSHKVIRYDPGDYTLRDSVTGLEWDATDVVIPCLNKDGTKGVDCPCLDCLEE